MLGYIKTSLGYIKTSLSVQKEKAGERGSRQCGPSGYSDPDPKSGQVTQG